MYLGLESNRKLKSKPVVSALYRLFRDTALFNWVLELRARYRNFQQERMASEHAPTTCDDKLWKMYEGHLKEMQMLLNRNSIKFIFVIYPSHHRWATPLERCGTFLNQSDRFEHLAKNMGIATLNLLPVLKQSNMDVRDLYLLPYDGHPSIEANKITANAIFGFLKETFPEIVVQAD